MLIILLYMVIRADPLPAVAGTVADLFDDGAGAAGTAEAVVGKHDARTLRPVVDQLAFYICKR